MIGGGAAGLAAACALADTGLTVTLLEKTPSLCGRAASFQPDGFSQPVDRCQHVLMRCCTNALDLLQRLGVADQIRFHSRLRFLDRQGRVSELRAAPLPAPLHLLPSFARLPFLGAGDKLGIARAFVAMLREHHADPEQPFAQWLARHRQTPRALAAFWRPVIVGALNAEPEHAATRYALLLFRDGFLRHRRAFELGVPAAPLEQILAEPCRRYLEQRRGEIRLRAPVAQILIPENAAVSVRLADGATLTADACVSAIPPHALWRLLPSNRRDTLFPGGPPPLEGSPIVGIHLWFDRPVTTLDQVSLVERRVDWVFNKSLGAGKSAAYPLHLVISAANGLMELPAREITRMALAEVREAFPPAREARLLHSAVTKEAQATFRPSPGVHAHRLGARTRLPGLYLAGDWTQTGWPATLEGAVRSGYLAAEAVLAAAGKPQRLIVPDLPPSPLARWLG